MIYIYIYIVSYYIIHIILKLRNAEDLWDCDSVFARDFATLSAISVARSFRDLSSPLAADVDSLSIHSRALGQVNVRNMYVMSETFTQTYTEVQICSDLKLVCFPILLPLCFRVYTFHACSKSISWPSPKCGCHCMPPWYVSLRVRTPPMSARTSVTAGKYCFS